MEFKKNLYNLRRAGIRVMASAVTSLMILTGASHAVPITDFVFIINATGSMGSKIGDVKAGFARFVGGLSAASIDAQFAIVLFGGVPELVLDFTSSQVATQAAFDKIQFNALTGFQNSHNQNPEAGLEAIRMVLGAAPNSVLDNNNITGDGILNFRGNARKNLILVTDEDSDRPKIVANRFAGQTNNEPRSVLNAAWQAEVDATATAVIDNQAFLNMLINRGDNPTRYQYGDNLDDVSDGNLLNFDGAAALVNLLADTVTNNSLQEQVLGAGLIARTFNVADANVASFVNTSSRRRSKRLSRTAAHNSPNPAP